MSDCASRSGPIKLCSLPQFGGKEITIYTDNVKKKGETVASSVMKKIKADKNGNYKVTIQPMGGILLID